MKFWGEEMATKNLIKLERLFLIVIYTFTIIGCEISRDMMNYISENFIFMKKLKEIKLIGKKDDKIVNNIGDSGCNALFRNAKYIVNLEKLYLWSNK